MVDYCFPAVVLLLTCFLWGAYLSCNASGEQGGCRRVKFLPAKNGHYLEGHVFLNLTIGIHTPCHHRCTMERECVSVNIGPAVNDKIVCELSNSDHLQHPQNLIPRHDWTYRGTENLCATDPCLNNGKCYLGYTAKKYLCECPAGYTGENCEKVLYKNCAELYNAGHRISGVYTINPDNGGAFDVYCDQTTAGGGWTVFQKRLDGSVDFYRGWDDYKRGFGSLNGEYWLGLDKIHRLTKEQSRLRVELEETTGETAYAEYDLFVVADKANEYKLSLGTYSGTAGDSLSIHHGMAFSTKDQDNDIDSTNCAETFKGAWWYQACQFSNLNGLYNYSVTWYHWKGYQHSAKRAEMKMKPLNA